MASTFIRQAILEKLIKDTHGIDVDLRKYTGTNGLERLIQYKETLDNGDS